MNLTQSRLFLVIRLLIGRRHGLPFSTEYFADIAIVHVRAGFKDLAPFFARPHHKCVHGSFDVIVCALRLLSLRPNDAGAGKLSRRHLRKERQHRTTLKLFLSVVKQTCITEDSLPSADMAPGDALPSVVSMLIDTGGATDTTGGTCTCTWIGTWPAGTAGKLYMAARFASGTAPDENTCCGNVICECEPLLTAVRRVAANWWPEVAASSWGTVKPPLVAAASKVVTAAEVGVVAVKGVLGGGDCADDGGAEEVRATGTLQWAGGGEVVLTAGVLWKKKTKIKIKQIFSTDNVPVISLELSIEKVLKTDCNFYPILSFNYFLLCSWCSESGRSDETIRNVTSKKRWKSLEIGRHFGDRPNPNRPKPSSVTWRESKLEQQDKIWVQTQQPFLKSGALDSKCESFSIAHVLGCFEKFFTNAPNPFQKTRALLVGRRKQ